MFSPHTLEHFKCTSRGNFRQFPINPIGHYHCSAQEELLFSAKLQWELPASLYTVLLRVDWILWFSRVQAQNTYSEIHFVFEFRSWKLERAESWGEVALISAEVEEERIYFRIKIQPVMLNLWVFNDVWHCGLLLWLMDEDSVWHFSVTHHPWNP